MHRLQLMPITVHSLTSLVNFYQLCFPLPCIQFSMAYSVLGGYFELTILPSWMARVSHNSGDFVTVSFLVWSDISSMELWVL